ncbi:NAD-P-binding protein [Mycena metata]|uniref:NAD-P-binding protein n=1 Tax=Mycena metata TaxID=1033252 RepID=A0AAD7IEN3_9AGAR|nr:NAD-P-binding protein [Mycena metata]
MPPPPENLSLAHVHDIYPGIDPEPHFSNKTYAGKAVLITGGSRGIGREIAIFYARAGASVSIVARTESTLNAVKSHILSETPSAQVITFAADVVDTRAMEAAVGAALVAFGKLDIVIASAGKADRWDTSLTDCDPEAWWSTVETNLRGVYNIFHFAVPELSKTRGYCIALGSASAQYRYPCGSPYIISKHALNRLTEYIPIENPAVKAFTLDPGAIKTDMTALNPAAAPYLIDTLALPAATCLRLTSGREDWLSGRYLSANWNLDEVEEVWKASILREDALVNRLHIPALHVGPV